LLAVRDRERLLEIWQRVERQRLSVRETEAMAKSLSERFSREHSVKRHAGRDPVLTDLAARLQQRYGTAVSIFTKGRKGSIQINYYSTEDLERLIDLLLR
jgi:ParB family chromosome partitioning protein